MTNYVYGGCITREMVRQHAEDHDQCVMGTIVLVALGIRGECTGFCKNKNRDVGPGYYNVFWTRDDYDCYLETFHEDEIMEALSKVKITAEKRY